MGRLWPGYALARPDPWTSLIDNYCLVTLSQTNQLEGPIMHGEISDEAIFKVKIQFRRYLPVKWPRHNERTHLKGSWLWISKAITSLSSFCYVEMHQMIQIITYPKTKRFSGKRKKKGEGGVDSKSAKVSASTCQLYQGRTHGYRISSFG